MTLVVNPELGTAASLAERTEYAGNMANEALRRADYATAAAMVVSVANLSPASYPVNPSPFAISLARLAETGSMRLPGAETPAEAPVQ